MTYNQVYHAGIDLHKKTSYITVLDSNGNELGKENVKNTTFAIQNALLKYNHPINASVEATFNTNWLVNTLKNVNINTQVAHPSKLKAISASKIKSDRIDSKVIAKLGLHNMLPLAYTPTAKKERELRDLLRFRDGLVQQRTVFKNKCKMILLRNCIFEFPYTKLFCQKGQAWILTQNVQNYELDEIKVYLELINSLTNQINNQDKKIKQEAENNYQAKLLMSVPGIGSFVAMVLIAEIGDIQRFKSSKQLCSFAGLVPSTYSSADKTTHGNVTKTGSHLIRHALSEAIEHTVIKDEYFKKIFNQWLQSKGRSKAKVACMRKLLAYVFIMLKNDLKFDQLSKGEQLA